MTTIEDITNAYNDVMAINLNNKNTIDEINTYIAYLYGTKYNIEDAIKLTDKHINAYEYNYSKDIP